MRSSIFVLTDISSLTAGVREPDDGQSLIRLLAHASEFDIRGLAAASNLGHGHVTRPELIHQVIDAYAKVQANLRLHDWRYPDADDLRARVWSGNPVAGPGVPVFDCIGPNRDTPASNALIAAVDELPERRKGYRFTLDFYQLWVLAWGGTCDLAQALWRVRNDRSPQELYEFVSALRVHAVYDQDSTGPWIKSEFPGLTYLTHRHAIRGMYRGGDTSLVSPKWVRENIHGHGPLGDLYPVYDGGDVFSGRLGPVRGVKEGDTPTFLRLLPFFDRGASYNPDTPTWGGHFRTVASHRWEDVGPLPEDAPDDPAPGMSAIYRYRSAYQNEFAARMDWCVRPPGQVSLPPEVSVVGGVDYGILDHKDNVLVGEFDASGSMSPDGSPLRFRWEWVPLREHGPAPFLHGSDSPHLSVVFPPDTPPQDLYLRLAVTTTGDVPLTRYGDNLWTWA